MKNSYDKKQEFIAHILAGFAKSFGKAPCASQPQPLVDAVPSNHGIVLARTYKRMNERKILSLSC
jgi:hypothetical protein